VLRDRLFFLVNFFLTHELLDDIGESGMLRILRPVFHFFRPDLPFDGAPQRVKDPE
jgi:hypothetical protein